MATINLPLPIPRGGSRFADDDRKAKLKEALANVSEWNPGVLGCQLLQWKVTPKYHDITTLIPIVGKPGGVPRGVPLPAPRGPDSIGQIPDFYSAWPEDARPRIAKATYQNTQKALSGVFKLCLHKYYGSRSLTALMRG